MKYWCEFAWLGGDTVSSGVVIEVVNGRFAAVSTGEPSPIGCVELNGLTLPGLANAHSHAFHRALRGRAAGDSFWTWRDGMYQVAQRLDPDVYERLARAVFGEMVLAGITTVGEFHYVHHQPGGEPYSDPNEMTAALARAANAAGVRMTVLDTCYLAGGIDEPLNQVQKRFSDGDVVRWAERVDAMPSTQRLRIGAAIHSVRAVDPVSIEAMVEWANGRPLHCHVSEQPAENEESLAAYGQSPTELLAAAGALSPTFTAVHATHVTNHDIDLLGTANAVVCMCPTTERDLADGVGPARALVESGAVLALGSDSNAVIDLFEESRGVELDERLVTGRRGSHLPSELLAAASTGGHRSLGWDDVGTIQVGMRADLVTVGLDSVRLAGSSQPSLLDSIVFAATAADVTTVMVDGELVVEGGMHISLDVPRELASGIAEVWSKP